MKNSLYTRPHERGGGIISIFQYLLLLVYLYRLKNLPEGPIVLGLYLYRKVFLGVAERKGFEPLVPLTVLTLSRRVPLTTQPSLQ